MLICVFLLLFTQVSASSFLLHNRTKRQAKSKCPSCQKSSLCAPKYELFPGHTACLPKSASAKPIVWTEAEKMEIVTHHNQLRAAVQPPAANMLKMSWDSELEMLAKRWAEACKKNEKGSFYHDDIRFIPGRFHVGQNLAWGFSTIKESTTAWNNENADYAQYFNTLLQNFPPGPQVGHYTQLVWASSSLIGCAASTCDTTNYYVCNYGPGGNNMPFSSPYIQGRTAGEMCSDHKTSDGLCDCGGLACENFGYTNAADCSCNCSYTGKEPPRCSLDCGKPDGHYCGTQASFMAEHCTKAYMVASCPHLCGICPCAESKYTSTMCSRSDPSINHVGHVFTQMIAVFLLALLF
ncbi:hypothetical protein BsWGS_06630 [Bradybaena similaris]